MKYNLKTLIYSKEVTNRLTELYMKLKNNTLLDLDLIPAKDLINKELSSKGLISTDNLNILDDKSKISPEIWDKLSHDSFKRWIVGFQDAEGNFRIARRTTTKEDGKTYLRYTFEVKLFLHVDDELILKHINTILNNPNQNIYYRENDEKTKIRAAYWIFSDRKFIIKNIIPIFDKYMLFTKKHYDYKLWRAALFLYESNRLHNVKIDDYVLKLIYDNHNKYTLNEGKLNLDEIKKYPTVEEILPNMNIDWLLGFTEGEGSFVLKTSKQMQHFEISQHTYSQNALYAILKYLNTLKPDVNCPYPNEILTIKENLYPDKHKMRIMFSSTDYFYWVLIPQFIMSGMHSRKQVDFLLWTACVIMKKHGLFRNKNNTIALDMYKSIQSVINNKRYYKDINELINIDDIINVLNMEPIYDLNLPHDKNYRKRSKL